MSPKRSCTTLPSSSISVAVVEGNDDLLIEILLFLPEKSLVRFKLVSQRWRSLISTPSFCRRHTLHQPRRRRETQPLVIREGRHGSKYYVCNPRNPRTHQCQLRFRIPKPKLLQSCNGLLLLATTVKGERKRHYVFNPITKQQRELSPLPNSYAYEARYLMFDPFVSPHYKVVCFANRTEEISRTVVIYLYNSETHEWNLYGEQSFDMMVSWRNGYYFNGGICYLGMYSSMLFVPDHNLIKIPNFPHIPNPNLSSGTRWSRYSTRISNGVILCVALSHDEKSNLLYVWEMKENENRWSSKYRADMDPVLAVCGGGDCSGIDFLSVIWEENEGDSVLLLDVRGREKVYKLYDDVFLDLRDYVAQCRKENKEWYFSDSRHLFNQSLALV